MQVKRQQSVDLFQLERRIAQHNHFRATALLKLRKNSFKRYSRVANPQRPTFVKAQRQIGRAYLRQQL